jgi:uncharacterized protein YcbK (DUF882 family)
VIRIGVALAIVLVVSIPGAGADDGVAKKDRERAAKSTKHGPVPRAGTKPPKHVNFYNTWTHEWLALEPDRPPAQRVVDRFLRDHFTNAPAEMEPRLIMLALGAAKKFRSDTVHVVSAFRHPKYNLILRKKGHQVARDSQHTHGNAIDFYLPNTPTMLLHAWAKDQRIGGVGLYRQSGFVHMDTGKVRYWSGE